MVVARKHMYKRQCTILLKHTSGSFEDGQIYQGNVMWHTGHCSPECDISVSKLLGFETFAKSLRVSVSENLVSEKKSRFRFQKNLVSEKSLGLGFGKFGLKKEKIQITRTVLVMMSQICPRNGPI